MTHRTVRLWREKNDGFTLVELLVVIVILGILSAIAVPVLLNQRKKAEDTAAKSDVVLIAKNVRYWYLESTTKPVVAASSTSYFLSATSSKAAVNRIGGRSRNVVPGTHKLTSASAWCVAVNNPMGDKSKAAGTSGGYKYSATGGLATGTC